MKFPLIAAFLVCIPLALQAQSGAIDTSAVDPDIKKMAKQSALKAVTRLGDRILDWSPTGIINEEIIQIVAKRDIADSKASTMRNVIKHDLDFDGVLSADEIDVARVYMQREGGRKRSRFEVLLVQADVDADGALSWEELRAHLQNSDQIRNPSERAVREMRSYLTLDINGDKEIDIPEMIRMINAINPCNC